MEIWSGVVNSWIAVLIQLASMIAVCGICWNGVLVIIDSAIHESGEAFSAALYRIIGIVAALIVIFAAPALVGELQAALSTPLVP